MANSFSKFPEMAKSIGGKIGSAIMLIAAIGTLITVLGHTTMQIIETYNKSEIPIETLKFDFEEYKKEQEKKRKKDLETMQIIADQTYMTYIIVCKINNGPPNRTYPSCSSIKTLPLPLNGEKNGPIFQFHDEWPYRRDLSVDVQ